MRKRLIFAAIATALVSGHAFGSSFSVTPADATGPLGGGATSPATIGIAFAQEGDTADGVQVELAFDDTLLDVSVAGVNNGSCGYVADSGLITLAVLDLGGNALADQVYCNMTFTVDPAAPEGAITLDLQNGVAADNGSDIAVPTLSDGTITVIAAPPDVTLSYVPAPPGPVTFPAANVGATSNASITVNAGGSFGSGTITGCSATAGFAVTSGDLSIAAGDSDTIDLTCTAAIAAQTGTVTCTETDSDSPGGVDRTWNLSCPAGNPVPVAQYDDNVPPPGPGGVINCSGSPDSTTNRVLTISNNGIAGAGSDMTVTGCSAAGAGISVDASSLPDTLAVGESVDVTVSCMIGPEDSAPLDGTVTCTSDAPNGTSVTYDVTGAPITTPPPLPAPDLIPANSLWSKLMLIGVFAGLGALVLALRRH